MRTIRVLGVPGNEIVFGKRVRVFCPIGLILGNSFSSKRIHGRPLLCGGLLRVLVREPGLEDCAILEPGWDRFVLGWDDVSSSIQPELARFIFGHAVLHMLNPIFYLVVNRELVD